MNQNQSKLVKELLKLSAIEQAEVLCQIYGSRDYDNEGQIIFYSNVWTDDDGNLVDENPNE